MNYYNIKTLKRMKFHFLFFCVINLVSAESSSEQKHASIQQLRSDITVKVQVIE